MQSDRTSAANGADGADAILDALVIGSGFGGSVSALRLREKGYSVTVLERGKRFAPTDFAKTNWDVRRSLWLPLAKCFGILRLSLFSDVFVLSGAGVGGGSLVYANTLYVPPPTFFRSGAWAKIKDWETALAPHYRVAQFLLGVTQNTFEGEPDRVLEQIANEQGKGHTYVRTPSPCTSERPENAPPIPTSAAGDPIARAARCAAAAWWAVATTRRTPSTRTTCTSPRSSART
jgi:cholesterol oxidase